MSTAHIHSRLKASTAAAHQRLEADLDIHHRVRSRRAYRSLLMGFFVAHRSIEGWLAAAPLGPERRPWELPARRKADTLRRDLLALGCHPDQLAALPVAELPALGWRRPAALGCLYVCEGATLGGAVLSRHFAASLGIGAGEGQGGDFFAGYRQQTGAMWRAWLEVLAAELRRPADLQAACVAAEQTFDFFSQTLLPRLAEEGGEVSAHDTHP